MRKIILCALLMISASQPWIAAIAQTENDRTENGRGGPFLYISFGTYSKPANSTKWRSPRLGVAVAKDRETAFWLERGEIMTDDWALEKVADGYVVKYKNGHASDRFREFVLCYDGAGESVDIKLSEKVTDGCIWLIDKAIEVNRQKGFQCGLRAKNGKLSGHYLGAGVSAQPEVVTQKPNEGAKVTRQFTGWRLVLTKEKQGELRFERVD